MKDISSRKYETNLQMELALLVCCLQPAASWTSGLPGFIFSLLHCKQILIDRIDGHFNQIFKDSITLLHFKMKDVWVVIQPILVITFYHTEPVHTEKNLEGDWRAHVSKRWIVSVPVDIVVVVFQVKLALVLNQWPSETFYATTSLSRERDNFARTILPSSLPFNYYRKWWPLSYRICHRDACANLWEEYRAWLVKLSRVIFYSNRKAGDTWNSELQVWTDLASSSFIPYWPFL